MYSDIFPLSPLCTLWFRFKESIAHWREALLVWAAATR